jgi:hypothetical protein
MKKILLFIVLGFTGYVVNAQTSYNSASSFSSNIEGVKITIYPNPATDYIQIQDKDNVVSTMILYNLAGRRIKSFTPEAGSTLDVSELPKGMYLMQFLDKKNKLVSTQRLSKK